MRRNPAFCAITLMVAATTFTWRVMPEIRAEPPAADAPFAPRPLARIEPGTVISDRAPPGWSQLVLKSQPKVSAGDVNDVPEMTLRFARMFFTSILLKAEKQPGVDPPRYRLANVAIGIGTHIGERDMIVSSDTYRALGADLGLLGGLVLSKSEEQLDQIVEVARSTTMSIVDTPTVLARNNQHVQVILRYALLVDPRDGRAYTLAWILDKTEAGYRLADSPLIRLKPNLVTDCDLRVDAGKFFLGTPSPDAFAVLRMPDGTPLAWSAPARALATQREFTASSTYRLELGLWDVVFAGAK